MLIPLHNTFLFQFLNETTNGMFVDRNKGQIILTTPDTASQGNLARWAKVTHVGAEVKCCEVGDVVLIAPGKWTPGFEIDGQKYWKSDDEWILALGDESMAYDFAA